MKKMTRVAGAALALFSLIAPAAMAQAQMRDAIVAVTAIV